VKGEAVCTVPPFVVNWMTPVTAPFGTVVTTEAAVAEVIPALSRALFEPANVTVGLPGFEVRFEPVIVTGVPVVPLFGLKSVIDGGVPLVCLVAVTLTVRDEARRLKNVTSRVF
jgi:hypothetical protein